MEEQGQGDDFYDYEHTFNGNREFIPNPNPNYAQFKQYPEFQESLNKLDLLPDYQ
jgi:hypothetical protein